MRSQQTRFILVVSTTVAVFATAVVSVATAGESKAAKIARALRAAPASISKNATIVDVDWTVLRSGSNGWQCRPGSAPGDTYPDCNDDVWVKLNKAVSAKAEFHTDRVGISYMLLGEPNGNNAEPFDTEPDPGEVWVQEGPHVMVVLPDPKMLEGISDDPNNGGPYVMWKGTPYAHIMIPLAPRKKEKVR
jgi:hypothetical protein